MNDWSKIHLRDTARFLVSQLSDEDLKSLILFIDEEVGDTEFTDLVLDAMQYTMVLTD